MNDKKDIVLFYVIKNKLNSMTMDTYSKMVKVLNEHSQIDSKIGTLNCLPSLV